MPIDPLHIRELLDRVVEAARHVAWHKIPCPDPEAAQHDPVCYLGDDAQNRITVCSFSIEDQGFPPGSRGHDGAAVMQYTMIRLPRDYAKVVFEIAEEAVEAAKVKGV